MNIKEINLEIAAIEWQSFDTGIAQRLIKGIESGRIEVLPGEIIETTSQYGE